MKLKDVLARIRIDINDRDKDRFEDEILVDYINESLEELFQLVPALFEKTMVVKLSEGELQQPCCCDKILSVDALTDAHGNTIEELRKTNTAAATAFGKNNCGTGSATDKPKSFNLLPNSENKFEVHPPLKPGVDAWARLTCAIRPCEIPFDLEADVPWYVSQKYSSIIDYVVYRALGTEHESQTSRAISEARRRAFLENLGYASAVEKQISK